MRTPADVAFMYMMQSLLRATVWLLPALIMAVLLRRAAAANRALLWRATFSGLILLPILLIALPPIRSVGANRTAALPERAEIRVPISTFVPSAHKPATAAVAPDTAAALEFRGAEVRPPAAAPERSGRLTPITRPDVGAALLVIWLAGVGLCLTRLACGVIALCRLGGGGVQAPAEIDSAARDVAQHLDMRRTITLKLAPHALYAPITWGVVRPTIMLPAEYASMSAAHINTALLHEIAHIKRSDWPWLIGAQLVLAFYWPVPLLWIAARRMRSDTEQACDDCVLAAGVSAPEYAAQLLEVTRTMKTKAVSLPAGALAMARPPLAAARIRAILDPCRSRKPASRWFTAIAMLLPALCIPVLSLRALAADATKPRSAQAVDMPATSPYSSIADAPARMNAVPNHNVAVATTSQERSTLSGFFYAPPWEVNPLGDLPILGMLFRSAPPTSAANPLDGSAVLKDIPYLGLLYQTQALASVTFPPPFPPPHGFEGIPVVNRLVQTKTPASLLTSSAPTQAAISWGPETNGIQVGLRLAGAALGSFAPGERIEQEAYLRNNTDVAVVINAVGGYEEMGAPLISTAKDRQVNVIRSFGTGAKFTVRTVVAPRDIELVGRFTVAFSKDDQIPVQAPESPIALANAGPGSYTIRQALAPMSAAETPIGGPLLTGPISVQIAGRPHRGIPSDHDKVAGASDAPIAWGPPHAGLTAGLLYIEGKTHYYIGERVHLAVVLRNVSDHTISIRQRTSFAFFEPPSVRDADGRPRATTAAYELDSAAIEAVRTNEVAANLTTAPSGGAPSGLRTSEIKPGESIVGYYLTAFVVPGRWKDGNASPGRYTISQPVELAFGGGQTLDTHIDTGELKLDVVDPDPASSQKPVR